MKFDIIAMGDKLPDWVVQGINDYQKRMPSLTIYQVPIIKRSKQSDYRKIMQKEAQLMQQKIQSGAHLVALDMTGKQFTSEQLATHISQLHKSHHHIQFVLGGPEGLSPTLLQQTHEQWSLSKLTLTHPMARLFLVEALYRSWAIQTNHPYHK